MFVEKCCVWDWIVFVVDEGGWVKFFVNDVVGFVIDGDVGIFDWK